MVPSLIVFSIPNNPMTQSIMPVRVNVTTHGNYRVIGIYTSTGYFNIICN